jgi:MtaA/CmuA family methyltransferase
MTSRERILAALALQPTDTVQVFPRDLTLGMDLCGYATPGVCNANGNYDAEKSAQSVLALQEYAGRDAVVGSIHDLGFENDLFGGVTGFPDYGMPSVVTPAIKNSGDLERARTSMDKISGRWPGYFEAHRIVSKTIGDSVAICANIDGPVTKACLIRGMDTLAFDMLDDLDFAMQIVDFATDLIIMRVSMLIDAGAHFVFLASACDDPQVIGPENYRRYSIRALRRIVAAANELGVPTVFHPHGVFTSSGTFTLADETIATGIRGFQFAEDNDLGVAKKHWGDRVCILGGLDVVEDLLPGPEEYIASATRACIDKVGTDGFILMASCSLHRGMVPEHLRAMVRAAHSYGQGKTW